MPFFTIFEMAVLPFSTKFAGAFVPASKSRHGKIFQLNIFLLPVSTFSAATRIDGKCQREIQFSRRMPCMRCMWGCFR